MSEQYDMNKGSLVYVESVSGAFVPFGFMTIIGKSSALTPPLLFNDGGETDNHYKSHGGVEVHTLNVTGSISNDEALAYLSNASDTDTSVNMLYYGRVSTYSVSDFAKLKAGEWTNFTMTLTETKIYGGTK